MDPLTVKAFYLILGPYLTYRMLKRANAVLEMVKEAKIVDNLWTIQKVSTTSILNKIFD